MRLASAFMLPKANEPVKAIATIADQNFIASTFSRLNLNSEIISRLRYQAD